MIPEWIFVILQIVAWILAVPYFIETWKGKVKPNLVSWSIWALAPGIAFFSQLNQGVGWPLITTFTVGFIPLLVILIALFKKSFVRSFTLTDKICLVLCGGGLVMWQITSNPNTALAFSIMADFTAGIPTIIHARKHPEEENMWPFLGSIPSYIAALLILKTGERTFENMGFTIHLLIISSILSAIIYFGKKKQENKDAQG